MVLTVVLALKHCLHSFLKQSDSLSTSLCPLSLVPLFFLHQPVNWNHLAECCPFPQHLPPACLLTAEENYR